MKIHSTNYYNTLITPAEDCPVDKGTIPPIKGDKMSIANYQFDIIKGHPFSFTSDEVIFKVFAIRNDILEKNYATEKEKFFSKGQPCLRTSPLTKNYGWAILHDASGKIKLIDSSSEEYLTLLEDPTIKKTAAMKSKK